jgi:hypothetical protein
MLFLKLESKIFKAQPYDNAINELTEFLFDLKNLPFKE